MKRNRFLHRISIAVFAFATIFANVGLANAAVLNNASLSQSDPRPSQTSVTDTFLASNVTSAPIKCIKVVYTSVIATPTVPTGFSSATATIGGASTYIKEALKNFFKAKPYRFIVTANGKTFNTNAFLLSIANSNQFGNSITIAPKASLSDGLLDIVIVQTTGKFGLIFKLLKQLNNGNITSGRNTEKTIQYFQTKKMSIKNLDNAPFHIDGEPAETSAAFNIEIIERAFLLLQP